MQTFLPMGDTDRPYLHSAKVLDRQRLGKQRVECKQILTALTTGRGWVHHPATKQWAGYLHSLSRYGMIVCTEWKDRGYNDSLLPFFVSQLDQHPDTGTPPWLSQIAQSHRAALLAKDYAWYKQFNWIEEPKIDYWWPTKNGY